MSDCAITFSASIQATHFDFFNGYWRSLPSLFPRTSISTLSSTPSPYQSATAMCRITFLTHACGHDSSPAPTQCAIYHNYYSSGSVLDLASTLIRSAHECPFAQCHERKLVTKCSKCAGGRFSIALDTASISAAAYKNEDSSPTNSTGSSATSTYSNEKTLAILESAPLLPHKPLPPTPTEMMVKKVTEWEGWTKMNKWQKKIMRGNYGRWFWR